MHYSLFGDNKLRKIAIGYTNRNTSDNLIFESNCLFIIKDISDCHKNVIITFDVEGRLLNIKLGRCYDNIEIKLLERSFDGIFYIYQENIKNLIPEHKFLYIYYDYYEEKIIKDDKVASLLVSQIVDSLILIQSSNFENSNIVNYFNINDYNAIQDKLSSDAVLIIKNILQQYTFKGLESEKILFKNTYTTTLNVLPPEVRPDINPEFAIIQLTHGCWFKTSEKGACKFCFSYLNKYYYEKSEIELIKHIDDVKCFYKKNWNHINKIFLSDADPLYTKIDSLLYLDIIHKEVPNSMDIECFITTLTILSKSEKDWLNIKNNGVKRLYWGVESANDETLLLLGKHHNKDNLRNAAKLLNTIGIDYTVILMSGVGALNVDRREKEIYENNHIIETVKFVNEFDCKEIYISKLVPICGTKLFDLIESNEIKPLNDDELELQHRMMIKSLAAKNRIIKGTYGVQFIN